QNVGRFAIYRGSIKPGAGVNRTDLPDVGDYAIAGVVNIGGFMEHAVLQNTRLSVVMRMARDITSAIVNVFPLSDGYAVKGELADSVGSYTLESTNANEVTV